MANTQSLYELLVSHFADDLEALNNAIFRNQIILQDDKDGTGEYIAVWAFSSAIPAELVAYDRTNE